MTKWIERLRDPDALRIKDLDDPRATTLHRDIIRKKRFLTRVYRDFYRELAGRFASLPPGEVVELGSGGGFIKDVLPQVTTSDILFLTYVDLCFRADRIPFKDRSVSAFVMVDVFHHVKDTAAFLGEMARCLKPGGRVLMIEPANSVWGRWIFQNFHHETFDPSAGWGVEGEGPLSCGNGALPWIVLQRDREEFARRFPTLQLRQMRGIAPFRYLLSGGIAFRPFLPAWSYPLVCGAEFVLSPLRRWLSMFYFIEIERMDTGG